MEFVDTNIFLYVHDTSAGPKRDRSLELVTRLFERADGAISTQVLIEIYAAATKKLGLPDREAEGIVVDLGTWTIHRPDHADIRRAVHLQRRYKVSWWDALILQSATEMGCSILWTEDLADGQRYGPVTVRNPFRR